MNSKACPYEIDAVDSCNLLDKFYMHDMRGIAHVRIQSYFANSL